MNHKLYQTACEIQRSLSEASTLAEGTLQLLDDVAGHYDGDVRHCAFRALLDRIRQAITETADATEAVADALQELL